MEASRIEGPAALERLLYSMTSAEVVEHMKLQEMEYYVRYHNALLGEIAEAGYTSLSDYARQQGWVHDRVMSLRNLRELLYQRYERSHTEKGSKNPQYRPMRLRHLEDMFDTLVIRRDPVEWGRKLERLAFFRKQGQEQKKQRKALKKAQAKNARDFPLFADQFNAEEKAKQKKSK